MPFLMTYLNTLSTHREIMLKHTLFVGQPCHYSSEKRSPDQSADRTHLLEELSMLSTV